jgi:hypothetical protein
MIVRVTLIEVSPAQVRAVGGWVECRGTRYPLDCLLGPDDVVAGLGFAQLLAAARSGRGLLFDEADGGLVPEPT